MKCREHRVNPFRPLVGIEPHYCEGYLHTKTHLHEHRYLRFHFALTPQSRTDHLNPID